jgi:hypothetical protein
MLNYFNEIYTDDGIITSFYGMNVEPDNSFQAKLDDAKEFLGEKYLLAHPVEKLNS